MKEYEIYSNLKVPSSSPILIRADGRNFHQLSRKLDLKKPYDTVFADAMAHVGLDLFKEFNIFFIYIFSDEINILLGEIPFGGRLEKLDSVMASFASSSFTIHMLDLMKITLDQLKDYGPISFDARVIPLSSSQVATYFQERQNEAWRNCINSYAYWTLREKVSAQEAADILLDKKSGELHELLYQKGINIAEVDSWQKRGLGVYRENIEVEGYNPLEKKKVMSTRSKIKVDWDLPLLDDSFFRKWSE